MSRDDKFDVDSEIVPARRHFSRRTVGITIGIELLFAILVPLAYLRFFEIVQPHEVRLALGLIALIYALKTALVVLLLNRTLQPIERWLAARGRPMAPEVIERAGRAAYETPMRFAVLWAVTWAFALLPVTAVLQMLPGSSIPPGPRPMLATGLFSIACFAAALPLAYSILSWMLLEVAGDISLCARQRNVTIRAESFSLGARLVILAMCISVAPTSWMIAMFVSPATGPVAPGSWLTLGLVALVPLSWTPVCASFLARVAASPFRRVGKTIDDIVRRGDVDRLERVPIHFKDEVGELANSVNKMVDRLQESSLRIQSYLAERERLLSEAARRAAQLQAVLDNIVEAVVAVDAEGRLVLANASASRVLGLPTVPAEAAGTPLADVYALDQMRRADGSPYGRDDLPHVRALRGETIVQEAQLRALPENGHRVHLRTSAAPIRNERGAIIGAVAVARDVSELVALELMKEQFIKVAAHELKTPVTIMKGYSLALLRAAEDLSAQRRSWLEAVNRGADRINRIVDDILAVSQVGLDLATISPERFDVFRAVEDAIEGAPKSAQGRIRFLSRGSGPLCVRADPEHVKQVTLSLLDNAVKYSPQGGDIDVTVTLVSSGADGPGEARVSVRDHGVGIPLEKQSRIFEPFFRAHTDTPYDYGGLGVGLYLAKDIIERQGGRMWFESDERRGTTFHFTLPLDRG